MFDIYGRLWYGFYTNTYGREAGWTVKKRLLSAFALCACIFAVLLLQGCGPKRVPTMILMGGTWENDGNSFRVMDVYFTESYTSSDGEEILPDEDNCILLVVECSMDLAEGYTVHDSTCVSNNSTSYADHSLMHDPISITDENGANYAFLFCMDSAEAEEATQKGMRVYTMRLELDHASHSRTWQDFCLF